MRLIVVVSFLCDTIGEILRKSLDVSSRGMDPCILGYAFGEAVVDIRQDALAGVHISSFPFSNYGWFCAFVISCVLQCSVWRKRCLVNYHIGILAQVLSRWPRLREGGLGAAICSFLCELVFLFLFS